ncbi:MAG: 2-oxoglutarate dehydrogenase E1 [Pseudomonadota bacterium]
MTQPWATLLAVGANRIETRSWPTNYRGALAIHAAQGFPKYALELCRQPPYADALAAAGYRSAADLPRGKIIGVGVLDDLLRCDASTAASIVLQSTAGLLPPHELAFGDFSAGRFGFVMTAMRELRAPIAAKGMLGLWTVAPGLEDEIMAQLAGRN